MWALVCLGLVGLMWVVLSLIENDAAVDQVVPSLIENDAAVDQGSSLVTGQSAAAAAGKGDTRGEMPETPPEGHSVGNTWVSMGLCLDGNTRLHDKV